MMNNALLFSKIHHQFHKAQSKPIEKSYCTINLLTNYYARGKWIVSLLASPIKGRIFQSIYLLFIHCGSPPYYYKPKTNPFAVRNCQLQSYTK